MINGLWIEDTLKILCDLSRSNLTRLFLSQEDSKKKKQEETLMWIKGWEIKFFLVSKNLPIFPPFFYKTSSILVCDLYQFFFFFFFFFRQVVNCCTWTRRPWLFNIHTLLSYMFNGEITRIQTHDAVIFATKGNSTGDARLFLQQSWPRKTTKTCSTFVTCRNLRDSLYLYIFASVFFFLFFFIAFL